MFLLTKIVEIWWNWRCKISSLKIRRCKFFDKFHVWNHVCLTCLSSFGLVYIVLRQSWLSRRKKELVKIVCPICWALLNLVFRQFWLSRRFPRWKRIGRNDVCPLCIDHICVTRQTSQITIQPSVLSASVLKLCNTNTDMAHKLKAQKYEAQTV